MKLEEMIRILKENVTGELSDPLHKGLFFLMQYALLTVKGSGEKPKVHNLLAKGLILTPSESYGDRTTYQASVENEPSRVIPLFYTHEFEFDYQMIDMPAEQIEDLKKGKATAWGFDNPFGKIKLSSKEFNWLYDSMGRRGVEKLDKATQYDIASGYFMQLPTISCQFRFSSERDEITYILTLPRTFSDILIK